MIAIRFADGSFLKQYDPDAHEKGILYPTGRITMTTDIDEAMVFQTVEEANAERCRQSVTTPLRPDGLPNRPMTRLDVEFVWLGEPK